jgi:methylmalonyl-CoA mutase cobalamin-binding domain/chain
MTPRGRIVVGALGLDQHEVGAVAVSELLKRNGFEVIYVGRFNTPGRLAAVAQQEDADVVGVSVHSWELSAYAPELVAMCHEVGAAVAVGGSVLTEADERKLARQGVDATFGPYAAEEQIVDRMDSLVARARGGRLEAAAITERPRTLAGRVIVVTGAGRGLGAAYVDCLLAEGAGVVANDLDSEALQQLPTDDGLALVPGDVSAPATSAELVGAALTRFGRLDGAVANAGLLRSGPLVKISAEDFDAVQAVHVRGTFLLLQAAARHWRNEAKAGRVVQAAVVTTTSSAGLYGFVGEAAYSAAKASIAAMTLVAAEELGRYGVTVNAIAPVARTRLTAWMGEPERADDDRYDPAHVAPVVAWLLSDAARGVTGRILEVGGDQVSVADGWRPGDSATLPRLAAQTDVGPLLEEVLARAPEPHAILSADPALVGSASPPG